MGMLTEVFACQDREVLFPGLDLDSGLDWTLDWTLEKNVFLVPLLCQRGQGANAMPPGSPNTESCTLILEIVPLTKCTYCDNTCLDV